MALFQYQVQHQPVYKQWCTLLGRLPAHISDLTQLPFLPISLFKTMTIGSQNSATVFESSGTTGAITSRHYVPHLGLYEKSFTQGFEAVYGPVEDYVILGLLPAYLERPNSSLVYMVDRLIAKSKAAESGFYLYNYEELYHTLIGLKASGRKTLLIGVTFALLDFAEQFAIDFPELIVMETGGMKGRRQEITRPQLHALLKPAFGVTQIHSEYGMTELLSQAYCTHNELFRPSATMAILLREPEDPFAIKRAGRGLINVIDLANVHSCAFIATDDIGLLYTDGSFEVQGRADNSDLRGCNLMVV